MMRSTEMSMDDQIRSIHHKYQIPEDEAKEILSRGFRFNDVDKAALLSCLSGKTAGEILDMRKDDPWAASKRNSALTRKIYSKRYIAHRADRLHRFYGMDAKIAETLPFRRLPEPLAPPRLPHRTAHRQPDGKHRQSTQQVHEMGSLRPAEIRHQRRDLQVLDR